MSDLISREAMIEMYAKNYAKALILYGVDISEKFETATQTSYALKQAYMRGRQDERDNIARLQVLQWIPCSERLPNKDEYLKNDGRFIVTDGNIVYQSIYDIYSAHCFRTLVLFDFGSRSNFEVDNCVIAWMPLPEPYKGE